jgi:hypothetical protein
MVSGESIRSRPRPAVRTGLLVAAILVLAGCSSPEYSSPAWSGRIVDIETGAPIEGAVVVVRWEVETYRADLGGWLVMDEAVTDRDGIFHFKAWGPMRTPDYRGARTRLSPNVPSIDVFKSTYEIAVSSAGNEMGYMDDRSYTGSAVRKVYADGKVIALTRFSGTNDQWRSYLERTLPLGGPLCNYQLIPQMYAAVVIEGRRLIAQTGYGIPHMSLKDLAQSYEHKQCSTTLSEAIQGYLK